MSIYFSCINFIYSQFNGKKVKGETAKVDGDLSDFITFYLASTLVRVYKYTVNNETV